MDTIPYEIVYEIVLYLDAKSIKNLLSSNKTFKSLLDDSQLWNKKLKRDYPMWNLPSSDYRREYFSLAFGTSHLIPLYYDDKIYEYRAIVDSTNQDKYIKTIYFREKEYYKIMNTIEKGLEISKPGRLKVEFYTHNAIYLETMPVSGLPFYKYKNGAFEVANWQKLLTNRFWNKVVNITVRHKD